MEDNTQTTTAWPGAFSIYKVSKAAVKKNLRPIIQIIILDLTAVVLLNLLTNRLTNNIGNNSVLFLVESIINAFFTIAFAKAFIASVRGQQINPPTVLRSSPSLLWRVFALNILTGLSILVGLILFIVPGVILFTRLILAPYYLVDKDMHVLDAYRASLKATKGSFGKIWGIIGFNILLLLLAVTIIGLPFAIYFGFMCSAALACLYIYISSKQNEQL